MPLLLRICFIILVPLAACGSAAHAQAAPQEEPRPRVAVLDFGQTETGRRAADALSSSLSADRYVRLVDRSLGRDAARGAGYAGSLNMTLAEARDLGAAVDCDFLITGDAQTVRRSPSASPAYNEAYASIFVVSARTGQLVRWLRPHREATTAEEAEKLLLEEVRAAARICRRDIMRRQEDEQARRRADEERTAREDATVEKVTIEDAPEEGTPAAEGVRLPEPYRRLRPAYPDTAAEAEAEATVDARVEIGADGEVGRVEIVRWAGFGLDEAVVNTVRQMHFRPAMRDGAPFPVRVLLRYNFRRPPKPTERQRTTP
ncbi:MAG TPA: TonB family protein [Pyrinomonadaceae bacterium]|nr:TonB family protein [Pyrinomonadaceae bacterium]